MCIFFFFGGMKVVFWGSLRGFPIIISVGVYNDETVKYVNLIHFSYFFLSVIVSSRCCGMCSKHRQSYFLGT